MIDVYINFILMLILKAKFKKGDYPIMRKSISMSLCASIALTFITSSAVAQTSIDKLSKRLYSVEKKLNKMKRDTNEQFDELYERADENELQSALSKVKFGFDLENSVNFVSGESGGEDFKANEKWTTIFHLNMSANINDKTKFTGRIGVSKNWSDYSMSTTNDYNQGRDSRGGSALFLERAYIDYKIFDNLIFTIGRQPGSEGPGSNLKNNSLRQATYPSLIFNANGDGAVLTYKPDLIGLKNEALRLIYAKMYQWDDDSSFVGDEAIKDSRIYGLMFESKLPLGSMGDNLLILWGARVNDLAINPSGLNDMELGNLTYGNLYFENNHAFGTNFNFFVSGAYMKGSDAVDNSASITSQILTASNIAAAMAGAMTAGKTLPEAQAYATQTLTAKANAVNEATKLNEEDSWAVQAGWRYDFTDTWKLGYQYFHGSRYWYGLQTASVADPLTTTQTRGDAHDVYGIYQVDFNQFFRLGYTYIKHDYTNSGQPFGGSEKIDEDDTVQNIMLTYNVRF